MTAEEQRVCREVLRQRHTTAGSIRWWHPGMGRLMHTPIGETMVRELPATRPAPERWRLAAADATPSVIAAVRLFEDGIRYVA